MAYKILGISKEQKLMEAEQPVFEEKKYKNGWLMKLTQLNDTFLNVSVYDESDTIQDIKTFDTMSEAETLILAKYISWFEEAPEKNISKMVKMAVRKSK